MSNPTNCHTSSYMMLIWALGATTGLKLDNYLIVTYHKECPHQECPRASIEWRKLMPWFMCIKLIWQFFYLPKVWIVESSIPAMAANMVTIVQGKKIGSCQGLSDHPEEIHSNYERALLGHVDLSNSGGSPWDRGRHQCDQYSLWYLLLLGLLWPVDA